jgi:hypothetical protein
MQGSGRKRTSSANEIIGTACRMSASHTHKAHAPGPSQAPRLDRPEWPSSEGADPFNRSRRLAWQEMNFNCQKEME